MNLYSDIADDYYVNMTLATEIELSSSRETILAYMEQVQKNYPEMRNFYARNQGHYVLEEDKDKGPYRWTAFERQRLSSGAVNPDSFKAAFEQHRLVLEIAPYMLSLSPMECEALDIIMGFDFNYKGNHNQLLANTFGVFPAFESLHSELAPTIIQQDPSFTFSKDEHCRTQCRVNIESRTTAYQIKTNEYPEDQQLSVYVTARQYGSLEPGMTYVEMYDRLASTCKDIVDNHITESILQPLARTIALG